MFIYINCEEVITHLPTDHKGVSTIRRVEVCTDEQVKQARR